MTNFNISNDAKLHNNRAAAPAAVEMSEGDIVGIASDGSLVLADADSAASQRAVGVMLTDVIDLSSRTELEPEFRATLEAQRTLVGDRATFGDHGIDLVDVDGDSALTPGQAVYLAVGGGITGTNPDPDGSLGHLVQKVGYALTSDKVRINVQL